MEEEGRAHTVLSPTVPSISHSSQLTAHSSQLTAHSSQLTAHSSQLTAHSSQLTAALMGCGSSHADDEETVVKAPKSKSWKRDLDYKPIHSAIRWNKPVDEIKRLLVSVEAVNCIDASNGNRPIHIAAQNGHFEALQLLISKRADANAHNLRGNTALHMAVGYEYFDCAMLLIESGGLAAALNTAGFPAINGVDGSGSMGVAALKCAKTSTDVWHAFELCEEKIGEVRRDQFFRAGVQTKRTLGEAWTVELQDRFRGIAQRAA
jgi:ankyrin repeat protein